MKEPFKSYEEALDRVTTLWELIEAIFKDLAEIQPFENLRNDKERREYLLCIR